MIRADMIPDEVVEAAAKAHAMINEGHDKWWHLHVEKVRAAIAAALNAWPGAFPHTFRDPLEGSGYVLPLPQQEKGGQ